MLRGINLGGRHRVPMAELRTLLTDAGYEDVRTYVQSGNIVLGSPAKPAEVERDLQALISERFGFDVPVVVRNRTQLKRVIARLRCRACRGRPAGAAIFDRPSEDAVPTWRVMLMP